MPELTPSDRPERVTLDLNGKQLVFIRMGDEQYAAELDGRSLPIRSAGKKLITKNDEHIAGPTNASTANIDTLLRCLSLGATTEPLPQGVKLSAVDNWGHFRQNTFINVSIIVTESGVVELNEDIQEQDESYY